MQVRIRPSKLKGSIQAPPSKSVAHRLLLASALSQGTSVLRGIGAGEDIQATIRCLRLIGAEITEEEHGVLRIRNHGLSLPEGAIFPLNESGSTFRFMVPVSLSIGREARFQGSQRLMERGVRVYEELFREKGILTEYEENASGGAPVFHVKGQLVPGTFRLSGGSSSQFISGLLFALPRLPGDSLIEIVPPVESNPYIGLTIGTLKHFGIQAERVTETLIRVPGNQHYQPADLKLEGDWTNGALLLALRQLGHEVTVEGLDSGSLQGDRAFLDLTKKLKNESFPEISLHDTPDLGPVLFVLAALQNGAVFTGVERLRLKESDRLSAMAEELRKFGAETEIRGQSAVIYPSVLHEPKEALLAHNDHRIVMAEALLSTVYGGVIEGAEAVRKSWPGFFRDLETLGADIQTFGSSEKDL